MLLLNQKHNDFLVYSPWYHSGPYLYYLCRKESLFQGINQIGQSLLEILQAKLAAQKAVKRTLKLIDCNNTRIWASRMLYGVSQLRQRLLFILKSSGYSFAHNLDSWGIEFNGLGLRYTVLVLSYTND